jgi:glycosyltransferase involved in cell wall biosynthesis
MNKEKEVAKKITVIIPCYNAEAYIEQCIESVLHQTIGMENIQMILIDDASTDHTLEYLMKYEQQYPDDILLWVLEANEGQANARNIGIEHTETEYLAFLDADDWLEEDTYEKLIDAAERTGADLVQAGHAEVFEGIQQGEKVLCEAETLYALAIVEERKSFLRDHGLSSIWSGVYRTELFSNPELRFANFRKYEDNYFSGLLIFEIKS